jgi:NAD+ synthase
MKPVDSDQIIQLIATSINNAGMHSAVIGLSGGIDSATSLFLTAKAIGPDHIHVFHLPAKSSNPIHCKDAQLTAQAAGIPSEHFHIVPIGAMIQKTWRTISRNEKVACKHVDLATQGSEGSRVEPKTCVERDKLRLANIAARCRMLVLFDQAKTTNSLVIGTENRSESLLGYFTRFGDAASDIEPICHLYKTQVFELAKNLGVPQPIIDKAPSADLWHGQTDENELGFSYANADPILELIDQGKSAAEIISQGFDATLVESIVTQTKKAAFKQLVPYKV